MLARMVPDEEDVKKKTAEIPGSSVRRIKKKTGIIESKCPLAKEHEKGLWSGSAHVTPLCVILGAFDYGFCVCSKRYILWCVG